MTTELKEAVERAKLYIGNTYIVNSNDLKDALLILITAAQETERLREINASINALADTNFKLYQDKLENLRARIAELEKDRPEGITSEKMSEHIQLWKFSDEHDCSFGMYIEKTFPNGLRIVQDKEGG